MSTVAWIGTGVMGKSMCSHILKAGYSVQVYNRTKEKAEELIKAGAKWKDSPAEAAKGADFVFTIVGYPGDVEKVILGKEGALDAAERGTVIIDMTTSTPSLAETIYEKGKERGIDVIDAPVSGGDTGARNGTLAIMAGGDKAAFERVYPFFELMGENIKLMGGAGKGQHTKMSNQILIAGTMIGVVESLIYTYKAGMDMNEVIDVIGKGAASSWSINNLGTRIAAGNFDPGFYIKHFVKDMGVALEEARRMKLSLPGLALAHQFYVSAMALGWENLGTHGLYRVFERMNMPAD
ncbi:MAG: NAD(P)-dependent oxidoreductase [Spirochaetaceae bacterium]